jgi:hypothetical protein
MKVITAIIFFATFLHAQSVFEPINSDIYNFLQTLSIKGIIHFDYEVKPITRIDIAKILLEAERKTIELTNLEKELLNYYKQDFEHEINLINKTFDRVRKPDFLVLDNNRRIRFFEYAGKDFSFFADPMISLSEQSVAGENFFLRRNGFSLYGYALDNWSYSLNFYDNQESGNNLDITKELTPEKGVSITAIKRKSFEYDFVNASIGYYWNSGAVTLGKDYFKIGSGINGSIILNDKAPSFPFIRLDYKPADWLRFFYFHGFLISDVPDSSAFRYNLVPGRNSISDVPKFIALHSLSFFPSNNISLTLGESIVYSDRIQPVYLIPVMFFRVADHYLGTGKSSATGNAQLFADASYTNPHLRSKFYGSLFIDELSLNSIFSGGNLSAVGFTLGSETVEPVFDNSSFNIEYTRINPFVYMNSELAQTYANDIYVLGHWMGSNGDLISVNYKQNFNRAINLSINTWYFRKGKQELPIEQYQTPYPEFLYGAKRYELGFTVRLKYQPWHPVLTEAYYSYVRISDELEGRTPAYKLGNNHYFGLTISYGFY